MKFFENISIRAEFKKNLRVFNQLLESAQPTLVDLQSIYYYHISQKNTNAEIDSLNASLIILKSNLEQLTTFSPTLNAQYNENQNILKKYKHTLIQIQKRYSQLCLSTLKLIQHIKIKNLHFDHPEILNTINSYHSIAWPSTIIKSHQNSI